ncbi:hypothetical protein dsat_2005 [Alkalidesulfovibrio alkalitolerans DSM 16529]|jgi:hypothetical protein|uniref:Uncharacterized protein n=1 Tax=Alkalidesulfovibrio alkalitolerans DSM 16529 TaxID=1121439 RepID=S7UNT0_9BACT|nr:hypothetical protein [Alkalidesulfovibrio alkalitolerans]EPR35664.1 hypothetical protein dsat_2005 [Alkalidesulfovibrio alkalitolerans DSM 16529]
MSLLQRIALAYLAGTIGGLANSLMNWAGFASGLAQLLGNPLVPAFTAAWLYPRLVWGGLWGLLFLTPFMTERPVVRGLVLSALPSAAMLFLFLPMQGQGILGLEMGYGTPLFVIACNLAWGLFAGFFWGLMNPLRRGRAR